MRGIAGTTAEIIETTEETTGAIVDVTAGAIVLSVGI